MESWPSTVHINDIRLEAPPRQTPEPASVLKFEMLNDGERRVTDVMLEIAIREKAADIAVTPRTIVGPFLVGGHATIEAGYAVDYELLLKNLAPDCSCLATVRVVSARELPEPYSPATASRRSPKRDARASPTDARGPKPETRSPPDND